MEHINRNEALLLSKHTHHIPVPKIALGAQTFKSDNKSDILPTPFNQTSPNNSFPQEKHDIEYYEIAIKDSSTEISNSQNQPSKIDENLASVASLDKVLLGVSGAPLSQYNFYSYLRGYWQAEANLNFWLDVATHENLWAMWLENQQRKKEQEAQYQYYYESEKASQQTRDNKVEDDGEEFEEQKEESFNQFQRSYAHDDSHSSSGNTVTEFDDSRNPVSSLSNNSSGITEQEASVRQQTYKRPISEEDLHKSAKQIYRKYAHLNLIPEENRITMHDLILRQGRHNPVVFASAKAYVYHIMNAIYFPKFVEASIDKNLTRIHSIIALPLGMIALTCGIALELYYIFMALENRVFRLWGLIPVWIGWVLLQTALTSFLPPLSFFGVSEHKLFRFHKIREKSILHAHRSRALRFIFYDTLVTILSVGLLLAIPPIRLDSPE